MKSNLKDWFSFLVPLLIVVLLCGYLVWNMTPKKVTVGEITYETMFCPRQSAFNKTRTLMQIKNKDMYKAVDKMREDYLHTEDPQVKEEYESFVTRVKDGLKEQLSPKYDVQALGDDMCMITVINLQKKAEEDARVDAAMKRVKNF